MADLATRFVQNPLLRPEDVAPSIPGLKVECLLNPGVFQWENQTWLLIRVAERPVQQPGRVSFPVIEKGETKILEFDANDPDLDTSDPREFRYRGKGFLSTLSHLRLFNSEDGIHFEPAELPFLMPEGPLEDFGIEDARVATMRDEGNFFLTYTAVSQFGYGVGLRRTRDWRHFENGGLIFLPPNKDCALFEEKIGGHYHALSRPVSDITGGPYIWLSKSANLRDWGDHRCVATTRPGKWDSGRVGAGGSPIRTPEGWLEIYHGCDEKKRYCLGALLLDLNDPSRVLARSEEPIMEPLAPYEQTGFFGQVVFTNGHLVDGDGITIYYGASDSVICGARFSMREILATLRR